MAHPYHHMAWLDMLEMQGTDSELIADMGKDVHRLSVIAERFSKIGSQPEREPADITEVIEAAVDYMKHRISGKVQIEVHTPEEKIAPQPLCRPLIEWVFENLCKNAIDAMDGEGHIEITLSNNDSRYYIDIKDSGKGIARNRFKTIFHPGYNQTTRLGTRTYIGKTHYRGVPRRTHLCQGIGIGKRNDFPYRDEITLKIAISLYHR